MKNDNDKWLESLRESLDGFEVEPRPGIWDSIERDAAAARRRPTLTVIWRAVAAAACLALVVGAYFLMSNPDNGNVAPRVSPVITKTKTSAAPASAGIVTPAELIADSHDHTPRPRAEAVMAMTDDAPLVSIDEEPVCTVAPADSVEDRPRATTREFLEAMPAASTAVSHRSAANTPTAKRIDNGNRRWHIALAANNAFGQGSSASEGGFSPLYHIPAHSHMLSVGTSTFDATYLKATTNNIDEATATDDIVSFPVSYSASFRYMLTDHWGINAGISYAYATSERRVGFGIRLLLVKNPYALHRHSCDCKLHVSVIALRVALRSCRRASGKMRENDAQGFRCRVGSGAEASHPTQYARLASLAGVGKRRCRRTAEHHRPLRNFRRAAIGL